MCVCNPNVRTPWCPNCINAHKMYKTQQDITNELNLQKSRDEHMLTKAAEHARNHSTCQKVIVGTVIVDIHQRSVYGANRTIPGVCKGRMLCDVDGHCTSTIHSEIDAIIRGKRDLYGATIYVTRYPCENCARAIVTAGISTVVYGRQQRISKLTDDIFFLNNVTVRHVPSYQEEDVVYEQ